MSDQQKLHTVEEQHDGLARERFVASTPLLQDTPSTILKVATRSRPAATAGAIANVIRSGKQVIVQAIGPAAVNQAVKAIAIARIYLNQEGGDIVFSPSFLALQIGEEERTAICLRIEAGPFRESARRTERAVNTSGRKG